MAKNSPDVSHRDVTIGANARLLRVSKGLDQSVVAEAMDFNQSTLSATERGLRVIKRTELEALAKYFNVKPSDLSGDRNDDQPLPLPIPVKTAQTAGSVPAPAAPDLGQVAADQRRQADALEVIAGNFESITRLADAAEQLLTEFREFLAPPTQSKPEPLRVV